MRATYFQIFSVLILSIIISCEGEISGPSEKINLPIEEEPIYMPKYEANRYFPLTTDNTWAYSTENKSWQYSVIVDSLVVINGNEYFVISTLHNIPILDTIRIKDNIVWKFTDQDEVVWFDFNFEKNTSYKYKSYDVTVRNDITINTFIGKYSNCISFFFNIPHTADEEFGYVFAEDVGIVRHYSMWVDFKLLSFSIAKPFWL